MSLCRSCRAPIVWALTENGRRIPLDRDPYEGGSPSGLFSVREVVVEGSGRRSLLAIAATPDAFPGETLYRSHFATCPNAEQHRKGPRGL